MQTTFLISAVIELISSSLVAQLDCSAFVVVFSASSFRNIIVSANEGPFLKSG